MATKRDSLWLHLLDVLLNIVIIVGVVVAIRTFLISPFQVQGSSMLDTLEHREYIVINKLAYRIGDPVRGDVVVFRPPNDERKHYVKRIIGMPGDGISIRNGHVYLKASGESTEQELIENYLNDRNSGHTYQHPPNSGNVREKRFSIPEGHYFLMGDNRQGSLDSRSFVADNASQPFVSRKNIKGRVWFVAMPITKIHTIEPPEYSL